MSIYSKPHLYDYSNATTRPDQASSYASYAPPTYDNSYMATHAQVPSGLPNQESFFNHSAPDASYHPEGATYPAFMPAASRHFPAVTSYVPTQGPAGRKLLVYLSSTEDLAPPPHSYYCITFGNRRINALLSRLGSQNDTPNYLLTADVPSFDSTGSSHTQVPLFFDMSDGASQPMPVEFGQFTYTDATAYNMASPPSRKRKLSTDTSGNTPGKRPSTQQLLKTELSPHSNHGLSPFSQTQQTPNYAYSHTPTRSQYQLPQTAQAIPRYGISPLTTASQLGMSTTQQASAFNHYGPYSAAPASASMMTQTPIAVGLPNGSNPTLVRTSALQNDSGSSPHGMGGSPFNPYSMFPNSKAVLKLDGDLNSMTDQWTAEEAQIQRRLVRFRRLQDGGTINASFEPVTPEEYARAPGLIYVNCIYWQEKKACYVTSVDAIQLLEALVGVRFTVEEKNRIRRNLEGFRPLTVSKTRPDCEEFFKVIMGFPSPKPRNIEKDVKVFPWRILAGALKKIIGKYSASYSSTAGALPTSHSASASSGSTGHERPEISPPLAANSSGTMQYRSNMTSTNMAPHGGGLAGSQGPPDLRVSVPGPPNHGGQSISWHAPQANYTSELPQRGSWDFSNYVDTTPASATGGHYNRIPSISQSLGFQSYNYMPQGDYKDAYQRTTHAA